MEKVKVSSSSEPAHKSVRPALTPESRENQLIAMAIDQVEEQLLNHTASSQVLTHFLKLATTKEALEKEKLVNENKLLLAKVQSLEKQDHGDAKHEEVLRALRSYRGQTEDYDDDPDIY